MIAMFRREGTQSFRELLRHSTLQSVASPDFLINVKAQVGTTSNLTLEQTWKDALMSYRTILVNIDIDGPVVPIIKLAVELAKRCEARLIGFCAGDAAMPTIMAPEGGPIAVRIWDEMRDDVRRRMKELHLEFGKLSEGVEASWQETIDNPTHALSSMARLADLIVTGSAMGAATGDGFRSADPGSVLLQAGRPLLIVANGAEHVPVRKAVIAWKDSREARRAVADAVPLMSRAYEVVVVTVASDPDDLTKGNLDDVVTFLATHGIKARAEVLKARDESDKLLEFVKSQNADLVVCGAYGHSRIREWVLGGVTRSLLDETGLNRFMSN